MKTLEEYQKIVVENHKAGNNCAQSAALTFIDLVGIHKQSLFPILEGFGAGMGNREVACGSVVGCAAILSLLSSSGSLENITKKKTYEITSSLNEQFYNKYQTLICKELQGNGEHPAVPVVPCEETMVTAVTIAYNLIKENKLA